MDTKQATGRRLGGSLRRNVKILLPAVLLFTAITGFNVWRLVYADRPELQANGVPISPEIEERYGVRFAGIHLIAKNGLIDLRYRVVDAGKAKNFGHYTETSPLLISEESGKVVEVTIMGLHNHRVETGRMYYIMYRNTANALRPGDWATIQIGDLMLEHVPVQ